VIFLSLNPTSRDVDIQTCS